MSRMSHMTEADSDVAAGPQVQVVRLGRYGVDPLVASAGTIDVWFGAVVHDPHDCDSLKYELSAAERERADAIRHPSAKAQSITGRARLRELLAAYLRCSPQAVVIEARPDGKPVLCDPHGGLHFNLSHTHDAWAVVLGRIDVGIDLEGLRPIAGAAALVQRYFHETEAAQFHALPTELQTEGFFRGWTLKEAVLKGIGCGIRGLEHCRIDLDPRLPPAIVGDDALTQGWQVAVVKPFPEHILSVAARTMRPLRTQVMS